MTVVEIRRAVADLLSHDWKAEYEAVLSRNNNLPPRYPQTMLDQCFKDGEWCDRMR